MKVLVRSTMRATRIVVDSGEMDQAADTYYQVGDIWYECSASIGGEKVVLVPVLSTMEETLDGLLKDY